ADRPPSGHRPARRRPGRRRVGGGRGDRGGGAGRRRGFAPAGGGKGPPGPGPPPPGKGAWRRPGGGEVPLHPPAGVRRPPAGSADTAAVDGLSLRAGRGAVTAVLGPNGAGKTTTIEICEGYRRPDAGTVAVLGLDPVADARALRPRVGVMLQSGGIPPAVRPG